MLPARSVEALSDGPYACVVEYLSPEWLAAAATLVAADPSLAAAASAHDLVVEYRVDHPAADGADDPLDPVVYHLRLSGGGASLEPGTAPDADVRFRCDRATALAVARGDLGAQRAFMEGRLRIGGDVRAIVAAQEVLAAVGDVLAPIRPPASPG
jgi:hypothetical protein